MTNDNQRLNARADAKRGDESLRAAELCLSAGLQRFREHLERGGWLRP
jgi:hypothetical protein